MRPESIVNFNKALTFNCVVALLFRVYLLIIKNVNIMKAEIQTLADLKKEILKSYSNSTQSEIQLLISHYDNLHSSVLRYYNRYDSFISDYLIDEDYEEVLKLV